MTRGGLASLSHEASPEVRGEVVSANCLVGRLQRGLLRLWNVEMKVEQYWVIDEKGRVIYKSERRALAVIFAEVFRRGSEVVAVARLPR